MALVVKDRVRVTTTTTGTSDFALGSAVTGYQSFSVIGNNNTTYYVASDPSTGDWEVGVGTFLSAGPTLTRDTILESSNAGSKVVFAAGAKDLFVSYPAERAVYLNAAGSAVDVLDIGTLGTSTANISNANITAGTVSTTPTAATDIANKSYVDTIASSGITYHTPVKYEVPNTTGNLNATYNNGVAGVGATLTNAGTKAAFAPDGPTAQVGDRILIYNQTNAYENGVYEVTTVGTPDPGGTNWVLTRTADADSYAVKDPNALGSGDAFFITSGNTGAGETYVCNTVGTITFGTTAITFVQVSDATLYTAGTGLTLSGTQFSITPVGTAGTYGSASQVPVIVTNASGQVSSVTNTAIAITAGAVSGLAASATTDTTNAANITSGTLNSARLSGSYTGITGVGTLTVGTWNAGTIGVSYGGTGLTSYAVGDLLYADTTTSLAKLADVVVGNALISGGVGTAPSWGKIGLTTHVSGTLGVANGGTGAATLTGYVYGNGTGAFTASTSIPNGATTATSANTASAIVARDASGNFSAGTITAALSGNASTATSATTATNLAGGSVGTIPYQTAAATTAMLAVGTSGQYLKSNGAAAPSWDNLPAVNNGTLTMNVSGTGLSGSATFTANQSGNSTFTVSSNATSSNTASTIVARDASGNFSAGTITASLSGNATSATTSTNLAGGSAGTVPYQSAAGTTAMLAAGTAGYYLQANGAAAPSWVAPPTIGNGTLTMNVSGNGLSGSQTFTANQSGNATYTVTSNATSANTASTIVFRDASGNFNAGIVTATRGGYALPDTGASAQWIYLGRWSGMTQAGAKLQIKIVSASGFNASIAQNCLTEIYFKTSNGSSFQAGSTGNFFADGQAWRTGPNATTPSTIRVVETNTTTYDIYGNFASYSGVNSFYTVSVANGSWTHSGTIVTPTGNSIDLPVYQILDSNNYNIYAPTLTGTGASGTWGINITGNAATATTAGNVNNGTLTMNVSGTGLSGSATFTANQSGGSTFTVTSNATDANTASTIVARNASGNFSAGTITASLSGNATTATTAGALTGGDSVFYGLLYNALSGDLNTYNSPGLYSAEYTGSTNRPVASNGHFIQISDAIGTDVKTQWYVPSNGITPYMRIMWGSGNWQAWQALLTSGNYTSYVGNGTLSMGVSGNGLSGSATFTANQSGGATFTVTSNATAANTANTIAYRDASNGFAIGYLNNNTWYNYNDNDRNAGSATYYPNASTRAVRYFFANSSSTGTGGNYAGVLQFNPWDGTTASTGDASYQLAFGSTATNGGGIPQLNIRKGIDTTWNSWYTILHSGNYNNYSPTLTGGGASGTWGINVTGNAATATNASYAYNYTQSFASDWNTDFSNAPAGSMILRGDTSTGSSTGGPGGTWWFQQNFRHTNASNVWGVQIAWGWEDNANQLKTRNVSGGSYGSWISYLNSNNYNSYSPTLTGTGASGTWGINITGNAATATTATNQSGGTVSATTGSFSGIITSTIASGTVMNMAGQSDSIGYNTTAGLGTYIKGTSGTYIYGGGSFYDGSTHRAILTSGNYSSYALPLSGGTMTGTVASPGYLPAYSVTPFNWNGSIVQYYWTRIANISNVGDSQFTIEIATKTDYNYVPYVRAIASIAAWNNSSQSIKLDVINSYDIPIRLALDNSGNVWLYAEAVWSSYLSWTIVDRSGSPTIYTSGFTQQLTQPANSVAIAPGQTFRCNQGAATSASPSTGAAWQLSALNTLGAITQNGSQVLTAGNYNSYSPTLTGGGASGTWGINITGNAATATSASNVNNGTLTMNVSGNGLSGSQTFTANQSAAATFTVTSNATSANTASTIVFRDASGNFSANAVTTASDSTISTLTIGRGAGSVASNTAIGVNALFSNTTGFSNTAVGNGALVSNTTSNSSTAIGNDAMYYMRGDSNTAIGRQAMLGSLTAANNTGAGNVAVGFFAARTITSGNNNTALGTNSLRNVTTGSGNVGVGGETLYNVTTQLNQVAVGFQTMYYMGGTANIGIGYLAMVGSTTPANNFGSYNIALGQEALAGVTSGSYNIAIGYQALDANTTASSNVAIGTSTLGLATTATQNVAVGSAALAATTGSQNTAIGESAGTSITTGSKNTIIGRYTGNQGGLNIATLSNYIVLSDGDGNPRGYFDNNGNYIVGADIRSTSQNGGQMTGFRNMVINGGMVIDQRNNGAAVVYTATVQTYVVDRFGCYGTLAGRFTIQRNQGSVTPPAGFSNYLGVTSSAATTPGATDLYALFHKIEGFNFSRASFGTASAQSIVLSFWVRSSLTGTFSGSMWNSAATRNYVFTYTISVANTWERKSITVTGDTTGTWLADNGMGLQIWWDLGSGASNRGAAGSWTTNVLYGVTGGVNVVGTSGATFYITGVQAEVGTAVTPFEHRDFATEFAMCQRYYETGSTNTLWSGDTTFNNTYYINCRYANRKRANPTVTPTYVAAYGFPATAPSITSTEADQCWAQHTSNSTTSGYFQFSWRANAEL